MRLKDESSILTFPGVLGVEALRRDVHSWLQHFQTLQRVDAFSPSSCSLYKI